MAGQTVIVSVLADTRQFARGMGEASSGLSKLGGALAGTAKLAVGTVVGIGAALGGLAIGGGIARALKLDEATKKLEALKYSTEETAEITKNALASVKGTAYGLDSAVSSAVGLLAAGIKPGEQLTAVLTTIGNTAALAGVSMDEMGAIFNKVAANGRVSTQEMNQLADRGVPIWQILAEAQGVSNEELRKMISAGQVTAEMFNNALGPAVEGVAATMGGTFKGSLSNAMAALSRLGAMWITPALPIATALVQSFTDKVDALASGLTPLVDKWKEWTESIDLAKIAEGDFSQLFEQLMTLRQQLTSSVLDALPGIIDSILGAIPTIIESTLTMITSIITTLVNAAPAILEGGIALLSGLLLAVVQAVPQIVTAVLELIPIIVNALTASVPVLVKGAVALFKGLIAAVTQIIPALITAIVELLPVIIEALLSMVQALIEGAITLFTSIVEALPVIIPQLITAIVQLLPVIVGALLGMIPLLIEGAVNLFMALVESLPIILPLLIQAIFDLIPAIITAILSAIPVVLSAAIDLFVAIIDALPVILPMLIEALIALGPQMAETLIGLVPTLLQAGIDLIGGLVDGLWRAGDAVGRALLRIVQDAVGDFLSFLGIASPSRLFAGYGRNLIEGLAAGLSDTAAVDRAMRELQDAVADPTLTVDAGYAAAGRGGSHVEIHVDGGLGTGAEIGRAVADALDEYYRAGGLR